MKWFDVIYESAIDDARHYKVMASDSGMAWLLAEQNCPDLIEVLDVFEI